MSNVKRINLALQGGGAHGAFTWGVCDRILEDDGIEIAGISGTSAGALNGAAIKQGLTHGDNDDARANLDWLWTQVGKVGDLSMVEWMRGILPDAAAISAAIEMSPGYQALDAMTRVLSPYALGPLSDNPLRAVVDRFQYDEVCAPDGPAFFVNTTNVRTGKVRVFDATEVTTDVILASACLPTVFKAVEIDGEPYWDGGYTGNPALFPLFDDALPDDIVVVNINPRERSGVPMRPQEIQNRINEISFNSSLLRELRAIDFVKRLIETDRVRPGTMKEVLVHMIADDALMAKLTVATKLVPNPVVLAELKAAGRAAADRFLSRHWSDLNERGTVDLRAMFA